MIVLFYRDPSFLRTVPQPTSDVRFAGLHPAGFPPLAARARSLPLCAPALPSKRGKALGRSLRREEYRGNHGQTTGTELFPRPLLRQKSIRGGGQLEPAHSRWSLRGLLIRNSSLSHSYGEKFFFLSRKEVGPGQRCCSAIRRIDLWRGERRNRGNARERSFLLPVPAKGKQRTGQNGIHTCEFFSRWENTLGENDFSEFALLMEINGSHCLETRRGGHWRWHQIFGPCLLEKSAGTRFSFECPYVGQMKGFDIAVLFQVE